MLGFQQEDRLRVTYDWQVGTGIAAPTTGSNPLAASFPKHPLTIGVVVRELFTRPGAT